MGKMSRLREALYGFVERPSLIHVRRGSPFAASLAKIGAGQQLSEDDIRGAFNLDEKQAIAVNETTQKLAAPIIIPAGPGKAVAMVSMQGVHLYEIECQPYCFSSKLLRENINRLAEDKDIGTIVLMINSPGGEVTGVKEAGDAIFAARKKKPVIAIIDPLCASAAYWIGSQASEIVAVPSSDTGSIGVFLLHVSYAVLLEGAGIKPTFIYAGKYKVEGNPYEDIGLETTEYLQEGVNKVYAEFIATVARGRGLDESFVEKNFGQGRCYDAEDAKRFKMIDRIASVSATLARCGVHMGLPDSRGGKRTEAPPPNTAADSKYKPISFIASGDNVYVSDAWPAHAFMSDPNAWSPDNSYGVLVLGNNITLTAANGRAVYEKTGEDKASGYWLCDLKESSYEPMPSSGVAGIKINYDADQDIGAISLYTSKIDVSTARVEASIDRTIAAEEAIDSTAEVPAGQTPAAQTAPEDVSAITGGPVDADERLLADVSAQAQQQSAARARRLALLRA